LLSFQRDGFERIVANAVEAAQKRAAELAK
jgi:pyrroline-5-carboxylate reductase